jgi:hypothetical protein
MQRLFNQQRGSMMRRASSGTVALATTLVAVVAQACPVCAQRSDGGLLGNVALGAMVISPWIVALSVGLWIKRSHKDAAYSEMTKS